jgi:hypothetical protein
VQALLGKYHLKAANIGGQRALDKIVAGLRKRGKLARGATRLLAADIPGFNLRNPALLDLLKQRGTRVTGEVTQTMLDDLREVLATAFYDEGQGPRAIAGALDDIFPPLYANRGECIARSEIGQAQGLLTTETYRQNGVEKKEWLSSTNSCDICMEANGQVVGIDDLFEVGGESVEASDAHPNCTCDSVPSFDEDTSVPEELWTGGPGQGEEGVAEPEAPAVSEFTTPQEAGAWLDEKYPDVPHDLGKMDLDAATAIARQYDVMGTAYDQELTRLPKVATTSRFYKAYAKYNPINRELEFSAEWLGDSARLRESLQRAIEIGWHPKGCDSIESLMTHEFGHHLLANGDDALRERVREWARGFGQAARRAVSEYATHNDNEFFGEAFTSLHHTPREAWTPAVKALETALKGTP